MFQWKRKSRMACVVEQARIPYKSLGEAGFDPVDINRICVTLRHGYRQRWCEDGLAIFQN